MTKKEYRMMQRIFKLQSPSSKNWEISLNCGILNYQLHMIARIDDDTDQVTIENIHVHDEFSNCLKTKLN
jgi:hypothetical protein